MNDPQDQGRMERGPWIETRDIIGMVGLGLLGYGAWLVYEPAGFIAPGVILAAVAIFGVRN